MKFNMLQYNPINLDSPNSIENPVTPLSEEKTLSVYLLWVFNIKQ